MKKLLTLSCSLFILFSMLAQDHNGYIGISIGPSIPLGYFASKDLQSEEAGLALNGTGFDITLSYKLNGGNYGLIASVKGHRYAFDEDIYLEELIEDIPELAWNVDSRPWSNKGVLAGGFVRYPLADWLMFEPRAMIGYMDAKSMEVTTRASANGNSAWIELESANSSSIAYSAGLVLTAQLNENLFLLGSLDYLSAKPEFVNVETKYSDGYISTNTWTQEMNVVNLTVGLGYRI